MHRGAAFGRPSRIWSGVLWRRWWCTGAVRATGRAEGVHPLSTASREAFFANEEATFEGVGVDPVLSTALQRTGFHQPSRIQAMGIERLMHGSDVVLAAETGSGKTLAYLLPIMTQILREKQQLRETASQIDSPSAEDGEKLYDEVEIKRRRSHRYAIVLCPSVDLCQQVQSVVTLLSSKSNPPLFTSEVSPGGLSRYTQRPDFLLATPGSLITNLVEMDKHVVDRILDGVGYVVVDEADLMLTGSYRSQIDRLFQMLYQCEREMAIDDLTSSRNMSREDFLALPRRLRKAGVEDGWRGISKPGSSSQNKTSTESDRPRWKRQFVLAGATIPSLGTKNVRDEIRQRFPSAEVISTENLHKTLNHVTYDWIEIVPESRMEALLHVIHNDTSFQPRSHGRLLVFTKDASTVDSVVEVLESNDVPVIAYHKKLGGTFRRANLQRFRDEEGTVMVCTDGMARGMDVDHITHVIQSDFAPSAIAFVHRVGRTGRAGRDGKVTSLCTESDKQLADVIRDCMEAGIPIEGAFSRNRSFGKKLRRYGTFIPRGTVPSQQHIDAKQQTEIRSPV